MPRGMKYGGASKAMRSAIRAAGGVSNLTSKELQAIQSKSRGAAMTGAVAGAAAGKAIGRRMARMSGERGQLTDRDMGRMKRPSNRVKRMKRKSLMGK